MVTATVREENGEFCVAVAPATRTAGRPILTQLAVILSRPSGRSGSYTGLIGFNPRRLKGLKGDELPRNGPQCLCEILLSQQSSFPLPMLRGLDNTPVVHPAVLQLSLYVNSTPVQLSQFLHDDVGDRRLHQRDIITTNTNHFRIVPTLSSI